MMMGFAPSVGHAPAPPSSSSCSTLSPLAQPFTVDRSSAPKHSKPSALPGGFDEHLNYIPPRPSLDNWLQLQPPTSAPHPIPSPSSDIDSIHGGCVYYGSSLTGSDSSGFSYGQKIGSVAATNLVDAEPYYPQYTPAIHDKGELGMKELRLGLPKTVGASPVVEASPSDYAQNLSGFGYDPVDWTGQWKEVESSWKCPSRNSIVSNYGSSLQRDCNRSNTISVYHRQESPATEGLVEESSGRTQRKDMQASMRKIHVSSKGAGSEWLDINCLGISDNDTDLASCKMSRTSTMTPGSAFQQMRYSQLPDPTSPQEVWNPYLQNPSSYDISVTEHEKANPTVLYPHSMQYSSPAQAFGLPASCPISTSVVVSCRNLSPIGGTTELHNTKEVANILSANFKVPTIHLNSTSKGVADASITNNKGDGFIFTGHSGYVSTNGKVPGVDLNAEDGKESWSARKNNDRIGNLLVGSPSPMNIHLSHSKSPKFVTGESSVYSLKSKFGQEHAHGLASRPTVKISMPVNPKGALNNSISQWSEAKSELEQCLMGPSPVTPSAALNLTPNVDDSSNPCLVGKSSQELPELKLPNISSAPAAALIGDSVQSSSETFDQFLSAVDSPCWKGVSAFRRSPFGVTDAIATVSVEKGLDGQSGLTQHHHVSSLMDNDNAETISSQKHGCFAQTEAWCAEASFSTNQSGTQCSPSLKEQGSSDPSNRFGCKTTESLASNKENVVTSSQPAPKSAIADDAAQNSFTDFHAPAAGECGSNACSAILSSAINEMLGASYNSNVQPLHIRMTVMMMFYASELLQNSSLLKEQDHEVLRFVVNNLQACLSRNDGLSKQVPQSFSLKVMPKVASVAHLFQTCLLSASDVLVLENARIQLIFIINLSTSHTLALKSARITFSLASRAISPSDLCYFGEGDGGMKKAIEKSIHEQDENPQASLYKNLWLEAEAALCSMKHELAQLKIKTEKYGQHLPKGELSLSSLPVSDATAHILPPVKSIGVATDSNPPPDGSEKSFNEKSTGVDEVTATNEEVYSQKAKQNLTENFAVVGDHVSPSNPAKPIEENPSSMKEKTPATTSPKAKESMTRSVALISSNDCSSHWNLAEMSQPMREEVEDVESSVMARFRVLKSRIDYSNCPSKVDHQKQPVRVVPGGVTLQYLEDEIECSKAWPFITGQSGDRCLEVGNSYDEEQCLLQGYMGENCVGSSDASEQRELTEGFRLHVADLTANHPYMAGTCGGYFQISGYESPSSDWEHVLKEDLKWQ
ncbi:hypothetical protein ACLOJK_032117 [Asimina triloba]